jgi:2'-5' RNA ligase
MIRAFLDIELPSDLRAELATIQEDVKRRLEPKFDRQVKIAWVRPASMHLTLKFLGDIPEKSSEQLKAAFEQVMSLHRPISIPFARLGGFPRSQQPRILWVGPSESWEQSNEAERLTALHRAVEDHCRAAGFASEVRPFSPHLTLARIKQGERQVGQTLALSGVMDRRVVVDPLPADVIVLMKSELCPTGSIYTKLWNVRVGES